jgi:hypothetical protein
MQVQDHAMDMNFGRWRSQTLHARTKLGIFEIADEARPAGQKGS